MSDHLPVPGKDGVLFLPLGGCGQFGANFALYGHNKKWIAVDCGMGFADERLPGVDIIMPDGNLIAEQAENLEALFITHAHEDHIGGVAWLWPMLKCPIYATPFAAHVLERKFSEHIYQGAQPEIRIVKPAADIQLGDWNITYAPVSHSIPESCSLFIKTPVGQIVHTGDWCLDPTPTLGNATDPTPFIEAGKAGVMACVGDSTNSLVTKKASSETDVAIGLQKVFEDAPRKIAITIFSSNVGRILSIHAAAKACGRKVALVGRSLESMVESARATGHVGDDVHFLSRDDVQNMSGDKIVFICTGSQGESRAALSRIACNMHPFVKLKPGDTAIFSSRSIPGNEVAINDIKNNLLAMGVEIVTSDEACIHVSGHPNRDDLSQMIDWLCPNALLAVHGERAQTEAHAALASEKQVSHVHVPVNGELIKISDKGLEPLRHYPLQFNAIDFDRMVPADHISILERRKMSFNGAVFASLSVDREHGDVLDCQISVIGLLDVDDPADNRMITELEDLVADKFESLDKATRLSESTGIDVVRAAIRRFWRDDRDVKPLVSVHIAHV